MNLIVITQTAENRFDCTITIPWDGFTETIQGLWDVESCIEWSRMMLSTHGAKYVNCC